MTKKDNKVKLVTELIIKKPDFTTNEEKVIKCLILDPRTSQGDIAKLTGLSQAGVNRIMQVFEKKGLLVIDDRIKAITEKDMKIVRMAQDEIERRLNSKLLIRMLSVQDIIKIAELSTKRYMLFKGDFTDEEGGLKRNPLFDRLNDILELK